MIGGCLAIELRNSCSMLIVDVILCFASRLT